MIDFLDTAFSSPNPPLNLAKPVSFQRDRGINPRLEGSGASLNHESYLCISGARRRHLGRRLHYYRCRVFSGVLAVSNALIEHRTLNAKQIDSIILTVETQIALTAERARRKQWTATVARAESFKVLCNLV